MEPPKYDKLSNTILDNPTERYCEIYKIINLTTNKIYVGQAVSHILNHKKYRPYGHAGRFRCHISEAFSTKKNQSHYLNNAIRKYGVEDFVVELIECCELSAYNSMLLVKTDMSVVFSCFKCDKRKIFNTSCCLICVRLNVYKNAEFNGFL